VAFVLERSLVGRVRDHLYCNLQCILAQYGTTLSLMTMTLYTPLQGQCLATSPFKRILPLIPRDTITDASSHRPEAAGFSYIDLKGWMFCNLYAGNQKDRSAV
jgi:hypothetical protein